VFPHSVNTSIGFVDEMSSAPGKFVDKPVVGA